MIRVLVLNYVNKTVGILESSQMYTLGIWVVLQRGSNEDGIELLAK